MAERRILIKKTVSDKNKTKFYGFELEVSGIEHDVEFENELKLAKKEVDNMILIYNAELQNKTVTTPDKYTREHERKEQKKYTGGKVTLQDITISEGSDKQKGFLVEGINKGIFSLEEVNAIQTYKQVSDYVSKFFSANTKK